MPNKMTVAEAAKTLEIAFGWQKDKDIPCVDAALFAAAVLRRVESGELAEVVHGKWKSGSMERVELICSKCGCSMPFVRELAGQDLPHCPSCGALMDGKDDNHEN